MSITKKFNGLNLFAVSVGHKMLRGGRLTKRAGQVVSYSPHVAELLGSASRAAIGGALILGSAIIAPAAMADVGSVCVGTNDVVCSGTTSASEDLTIPAGGTLTLDETLDLDTSALVALDVDAAGAIAITGEAGSSVGNTSGSGLVVASQGQTDIVLATNFDTSGNAVTAINSAAGDDELNITVLGYITSDEGGVVATHTGSGNGHINLIVGQDAEIHATGNALTALAAGNGNAVVTNDGSISGDYGVFAASVGGGNIAVINNGSVSADTAGLLAIQLAGASGDINVTNNNLIDLGGAQTVGIYAVNEMGGDGDITVTNNGEISGDFENGGYSTDTANPTGITVVHSSAGDVEVTNDGLILTAGNAIDIDHLYQGDVVVNLGAESGTVSFYASNSEWDEVGGANGVSVALAETSIGDAIISSNGFVYGHDNALDLSHAGAGDINVNVGAGSEEMFGISLMAAGAAIDAVHGGAGDVNVTLGEGAVVLGGVPLDVLLVQDEDDRSDANGIEIRRGSDATGLTNVVLNDGAFVDATLDAVFLVNQGDVDTSVTLEEGSGLFAGDDGIYFRNYGTGSLTIDVAGQIVTGEEGEEPILEEGEVSNGRPLFRWDGGSAIYAVGAKRGDLDVTVSGALDAADKGIALYHTSMGSGAPSEGDILVNIEGGSIAAGYIGVEAIHYGLGAIDIDNSGTVFAGHTGVAATHNGAGALAINNLVGGEIGSDQFGIRAVHNGTGTFNVSNAGTIAKLAPPQFSPYVAWDPTGISAVRNSHGDVNVVNEVGGQITGYALGIEGLHSNSDQSYSGNINLTNAGSVTANWVGVAATHFGSGNIDISSTGSIDSGDLGIAAAHFHGGNILIANGDADHTDATITADIGVWAHHSDSGNIEITNAGDIYSDNEAIVAVHSAGEFDLSEDFEAHDDTLPESSGNILVNNSGHIVTEDHAVKIWHLGLGDIVFNNLEGGFIDTAWDMDGDAVAIDRLYAGKTTVTNAGTIWADEYGLDIVHANGGDVSVTNFEGAEIFSDDEDAIEITIRSGQSNVFVQNDGLLEADEAGVQVKHFGTGDIVVKNAGTILSDEHGIEIRHEGNGDVSIESTGDIEAGDDQAIDAEIWGNGDLTIVVNNASNELESESSAVYAGVYGTGDIDITVTGTVAGDYRGISTEAYDGDVTITIAETGVVSNLSQATDDLAIRTMTSYDWDSWNEDTWSFEDTGNSNTILVNNGTIIGTVDLSDNYAPDTVSFTNNGVWDSTGGVNYMGQGDDTLTIGDGGVWHAAGSTTHFDGYPMMLAKMAPFSAPEGGDVFTIEDGGLVHAANANFVGLESLVVEGTLSSANGVAGDETYTDGDVLFTATSQYNVDTATGGEADTLFAVGDVTIEGGTLNVTHLGDNVAALGDEYTVIQSVIGEVTGTFENTTVNHTAFLGWNVGYSDTAVNLTYAQVNALDDAAETPNQVGVAGGLDSLAITNPLLVATLNLSDFAAARTAFNGLSGEIHPGARTAMMQDSRLPRNAVLERLQTPQDTAIWGQGFWNTGETDGAKSGNTAKVDRETWGVILGADLPLGENAVLGVAGSYLSNDMTQVERNATGKADTIHALGYVGATSGAANFKAGLGYAWGDVETTRSVAVGTISNKLTADYDAKLFQAFAEAGIRVGLGGGYVEPMANVTYLKAKSDAFTETGGQAALTSASASQDNTLLTVGSRFSTSTSGAFSVRGMLGWQHVFGALVPTNRFNFDGGDTFTVAGVAQSRDAAVVNIEANFDLSSGAALGIGYDGVVGNDAQDHAAKVSLRIKF